MFAKLLRFATAIVLILLLAPFTYTNASCSTPSAICGYAESVCLTKLSCTCAFVDITTCSNGERIGWNVCGGMFGPEGYVRINDPVIVEIAPVTLPDGTVITKMIQSWSSSSDIPDCNACIQEPTQPPTQMPTSTRVPPTATRKPPTATRVPPTSTWTPLPRPTDTPTRVKPSFTPILTQVVISTLRIEVSPTQQSHEFELDVSPIPQMFTPGEKTSIGILDTGIYDCLPASTTMILQTIEKQGLIPNVATDYSTVRKAFRAKSPDASSGIVLGVVETVVPEITNNTVTATVGSVEPKNWQDEITSQIKSGFPVIAHVGNWNLLAGHWSGIYPHSIVVYGLHDSTVYYIDPWDGGKYTLSTSDFEKALGYNLSTYWFITFKVR